ncbi:hypothetical protein pb186bvf_016076 [Paramecium bursaria]
MKFLYLIFKFKNQPTNQITVQTFHEIKFSVLWCHLVSKVFQLLQIMLIYLNIKYYVITKKDTSSFTKKIDFNILNIFYLSGMGCSIRKQQTRSRHQAPKASTILMCSTEAKLQIFFHQLSQSQDKVRSKSISSRCASPLKFEAKQNSLASKQKEQKDNLNERIDIKSLEQSPKNSTNEKSIQLEPQLNGKKAKVKLSKFHQSSQSVDKLPELEPSFLQVRRQTMRFEMVEDPFIRRHNKRKSRF